MDCPVCKNAMIALELAEVEVDYCTNCGGIWLDAGELELVLGNSQQTKQLLDSFKIDSASTEKRRRCPICLKKMQKIIVGPSTPPVVPALSTVEGSSAEPPVVPALSTVEGSSAEPPLLIDKCARGDGLWFDHGELQDVLDKAKLDKDNKIQKLLADIFPG